MGGAGGRGAGDAADAEVYLTHARTCSHAQRDIRTLSHKRTLSRAQAE